MVAKGKKNNAINGSYHIGERIAVFTNLLNISNQRIVK